MIWNERKDAVFMLEAIAYLSIRPSNGNCKPGDDPPKTTFSVYVNLTTGNDFELATGFDSRAKAMEHAEVTVKHARDRRLIREIGIRERHTRR